MDWKVIEGKWQKKWEDTKIYESDPDPDRKKCFVTFPYPYMGGPLHVGHAFSSTRLDIYARYMRMKGYNVLFPWAWHWTGETVAGAAERVKIGDTAFIDALRDVDEVPEDELKKFIDPIYMANYYTQNGKQAVKRLGLAIDWRREFHTTSLNPAYSKFIEWQYAHLKERNYVSLGTHPVVWCPRCESPTGDADRLEGEEVRPEEYVLMKFRYGDTFLPCATFRPETIYAVTNLWINPDAVYVEVLVDNEKWIVSRECAAKLSDQLRKIQILGQITGAELVGKSCKDPVASRDLLILPGSFVMPESASGLVYSVPAHAPYDWLAQRDLERNPAVLEKYGIPVNSIQQIKPISMIKVEGFGDFPAIELVDQMKIRDQFDSKAEEATSILYKKEFHTGILKEIAGKYAGRRVSEIKNELIEDFKEKKIADLMYDLPRKVVCRCTTPCGVKIIQDQWFLRYSDAGWKQQVHGLLDRMNVYPEEARKWFHDVVDWLHDWACSRKTGLGTPVPWSPESIVETLSDSTVYMAYYSISKFVNSGKVSANQLTLETLDYILLGIGDPDRIAHSIRLDTRTLRMMREEFLYWYPVDLRNSGKDLVPNHLSFFLFHHTALFSEEHWPRGMGVNGFIRIEGKPMHRSKGNFVPMLKAVETYGADVTRCSLLLAAENMDDPDWRAEALRDMRTKVDGFYSIAKGIVNMKESAPITQLERWLLSRLQRKIQRAEEVISVMKNRTALENVFFEVWNDFRWYLRRCETPNSEVLKDALGIWTRLMAPFAPHLCEQIWEEAGGNGFVVNAPWPTYDPSKIDLMAEEAERLVRDTMEDTSNLLKAIRIKPKRVYYYMASDWKWALYIKALEMAESGKLDSGVLIREVMSDPLMKTKGKEIAVFAGRIADQARRMPVDQRRLRIQLKMLDEMNVLRSAQRLYSKQFDVAVSLFREGDSELYDPQGRAALAQPYRPAIYIE